MSTRIDIEVTSDRGDGTFTWRAAGAKQPKGVCDKSLLPPGASVGDVLRAEAEFTVDGPELVSLAAPKAARVDTIERLEVVGTAQPTEAVTTQLAGKQRRGRDNRGSGSFDRDDRSPRDSRGGGRDSRESRSEGKGRPSGEGGGNRRPTLQPKRTHREVWIASLPDTHRPVAEQLMHEGRDGVAGALARQNNAAVADGRAAIDIAPIMRIADELMGPLAIAEWLDKADAAMAAIETADIRELRKVVVAGDSHIEDPRVVETQALLRSKLSSRIDSDQATWSRELREALTEGRVVRALRHSGRPVKAGAPLPADLVEELRKAADDALGPDEEAHRWTMVIEALAGSPIRRLIEPAAKPDDADPELLDTVERLAHRVPGVAAAFDISPTEPKRVKRRRQKF